MDGRPTTIRYRVLLFACLLSMITYLDRVCFGVAGPFIVESLGLRDVGQLKEAFTAFALSYAIFEIPSGWLGDRWGVRVTLTRIVLWWSLFTVLTGMVGMKLAGVTLGGATTLVAIRFLFGAGEAGAYPNIARAVHDWFPPSQWARVQGMVWMSGRIMGGLTPLVWMLLVAGIGGREPILSWRSAFMLFGLIGVAWCIAFWVLFRDRPGQHAGVNDQERFLIAGGRPGELNLDSHSNIPWGSTLLRFDLCLLSVVYLLVNYGWYFNITYLPSYLRDRYGAEDNDLVAALYKGGPLWIGAIGCLLGGTLSDALGRWCGDRWKARRWIACTALAGSSISWLAASSAPNATLFFLYASASAFCTDLTLGATWATCQEMGNGSPGVATAVMNTVGALGAASAGWLTGWLIGRGSGLPMDRVVSWSEMISFDAGYASAFFTYFVAYSLAAAGWLFIRPAKK